MAMNQQKPNNSPQVPYLDRWVDREHFSAFVYNEHQQKLAKSYDEFKDLLATGLWFDSHESVSVYLANKNVNNLDAVNKEDEVKNRREKVKNSLKLSSSGL